MSTVSPSAKKASLRACSVTAFGFYSPPPLLPLRLLGHPFVCFWIRECLEISRKEDPRLLRTEQVCLSRLACCNELITFPPWSQQPSFFSFFFFQPSSSSQIFINSSSPSLHLCSFLTLEFSCHKFSPEREIPIIQPLGHPMLLKL